tara:strand:+ start:324 stop:896 length:573 start_codon:yes stop_codon:yes gene_type:complete
MTGCLSEKAKTKTYPTYAPQITTGKSTNVTSVSSTQTKSSSMSVIVEVTRVIDGDTIEVLFRNGDTDKVRLLAIDTPEIGSANKPNKFKGVTDIECLHDWGVKAYEKAKSTLEGKDVTLIFDELSGRRGYYDRLLAYVDMSGIDFNETLIDGGYARVYEEGNSSRKQSYLLKQEQGIKYGKGLWGTCSSK